MATSREVVELLTKFITQGEGATEDAFDGIAASQAQLTEQAKRLQKEMREVAQAMDAGVVSVEEGTDQYNRLQRELDQTERKMDSLNKETSNSGLRFTELASKLSVAQAAFGAVQQGAQVAFDTIKRGAEVQAVTATFENLARSIDTTADVMLTSLREATQGMVSDFDLMTSANRFMAMGLAGTADEAADLAEVAVTLGAAMGTGPNQAMEDFALLLANQSIPRLDTFGISSGKVRERVNELTTGVDALDKETAFLQATMEEAEKTMVAVGGATEGTAKDMAVLEAELANVKDAMASAAADGASPLISSMSGIVDRQKILNAAVEEGIITTGEARAKWILWGASGKIAKEQASELAEELEAINTANQDQLDTLEPAIKATEEYDRALIGASTSMEEATEAIDENTDAVERSTAIGDAYAERMQKQSEISDKLTNSIRFQKEQAEEAAKVFTDSYNRAFEEALPLVDDYIQAQADMNDAQGEWVEVTRDNSAEIASINAQLFSDLDSDQKSAMEDLISTAEEGGAEWVAAFDGLQGDLSESQRRALIARRAELEASQGDIASVYTGDVEAFEAAQQRKLEAEAAFTQQLQENAFAIAEARIIAEGGDVIANTQQLLDLAVAQGLKTQEQADLQLQQTENTLQTQEATQQLMDIYLTDGVLAQEESERLATVVTLIGDNADLTTEQLVTLGLQGTENAGMITTAMNDTETAVTDTSGAVDTLAVKLDALPEEVVVTVRVNTIGSVPEGLGGGTTSEVMEEAGVN